MSKRRGGRGGKGYLLEQCIKSLRTHRIPSFSNPEFKRLAEIPGTYVIENYPHATLYGTAGRKEGYVRDLGVEYIIETKFQDGSGSVDEKLPHVWESFLVSPIQCWIVVYGGRYWRRDKRGQMAIKWFKSFVEERRRLHGVSPDRAFYIVSLEEFYELSRELWGQK